MPVSHLGLTVSHIPSATSFYLAALQPLGYKYVGTQGDSIGLGIDENADFFLCQEQAGGRVSPTHIAFNADNRVAVRDCYAAALNAGGIPSGSPSYRNNNCGCFNAAVCDLDGNTVEFIFRDGNDDGVEHGSAAPSESGNRITTWQKDVANSKLENDDAQSINSKLSQAKSRAQTAMDIASTASKSIKSPASGTATPAKTESSGHGKTILGSMIGAAAGAAFAYAMCKSESDNAKEEAAFMKVMSMKGSERGSVRESTRSTKSSKRRSSSAGPRSMISKMSRDLPQLEPARDRPYTMKAIEMAGYDDEEAQRIISEFMSNRSRPMLPYRSQTYDGPDDYNPTVVTAKTGRSGPSRAHTMPEELPQLYLEGPKSTVSRRSDRAPSEYPKSRSGSGDDSTLKRHDSALSVRSHRTRNSDEAAKTEVSRRTSGSQQIAKSPSIAPSQASTLKPGAQGSQYISAAGVPLPASVAPSGSIYADGPTPRSYAPSAAPSGAQIPLPVSREPTVVSARDGATSQAPSRAPSKAQSKAPSKAPTYISARDMATSQAGSRITLRDNTRSAPGSRMPSNSPPHSSPLSPPSKAHSYISAKDIPTPPSIAHSYISAKDIPPPPSKAASYFSAKDIPAPQSKAASYVSAKDVPTPQSKAPSYYSAKDVPTPPSKAPSYYSAKDVPAPQSRATSYTSARDIPIPPSRAPTYVTAASARDVPLPPSIIGGGYTEDPDEDDGLGDMETVVPDDSISCVDYTTPARSAASRRSKRSHRSEKEGGSKHHSSSHSHHGSSSGKSRHSSRKDEDKRSTSTVKPASKLKV